MAESQPELGPLVLAAIEKALHQDGECRLVSKGKGSPGLFEGGKATAAKAEAQRQCLDPELGLFRVREAQEGKGKAAGPAWFVMPTAVGIGALFARIPPARRAELRVSCAEVHHPAVDAAVLRAVAADLDSVRVERERLDRRAAELSELFGRVYGEQAAGLDQARERLDRQRADLEALRGGADRPVTPPPPPGGSTKPEEPGDRRPVGLPTDDADIDFQRNLCRELVFAWRDAPEPDARAALEAVMLNTGALDPAADAGDGVRFNGMEHTTTDDLMPGDAAVVVAPGWRYTSRKGTLVLAKSEVRAAGPGGGP